MRDILFRGKIKNIGEWVYGDLIQFRNGQTYIKTDNIIIHEVIPETIGQYTNMIDKNGNKIFEEDIVEGGDYGEEDGYGIVRWDDGAFWVGNDQVCGTFCDNYYGKDFEIIGNIHDNEELSEGGGSNA